MFRRRNADFKKFIIFAQGRTGSTVLVDLINSHPDIFCYGEVLAPGVVENVAQPVKYAEALTAFTKTRCMGFKVKVYQLEKTHKQNPKEVLQSFASRGWKIVYLHRDNLLDHAISDIRSEKTGTYHNTKKDEVKSDLIEVDYQEIKQVVEFREHCQKQELQALSGLDYFDISYEKDLRDSSSQEVALNQLFKYLDLPEYQVSTRFKKVVKTDLSKVIADYQHLEAQLRKSPFQQYLSAK